MATACRPTPCEPPPSLAQVLSAITKGSSRQTLLYLSRCPNVARLADHVGRTALHVAASCGQTDVVRWLVEQRQADVDRRDDESGWTPLHRALYHGQITTAQTLISLGASLLARDNEALTPLGIVMKDDLPVRPMRKTEWCRNQVYTWGDNSNSTLGHSSGRSRKCAEPVELFRKENIDIKDVVMCQYHTVFLSYKGQVYTCGHGTGGRLGHGDEQSALVPRLVAALKDVVCVEVAASRDHTLFLTKRGTVYGCGLNNCYQLGGTLTSNCLSPKVVKVSDKLLKGFAIRGICSGRFHTVFFTNRAVYTFGLNAGQLGHVRVVNDAYIREPREVSALNDQDSLHSVVASEAATIVTTSQDCVYALHEYRCRRIVSEHRHRSLAILQVAVSGGNLDQQLGVDVDILPKSPGSHLVVLILDITWKVFVWSASRPDVRQCVWLFGRPLSVRHLALSRQTVAFVTLDGEAFTATLPTTTHTAPPTSPTAPPSAKGYEDWWTVSSRLTDPLVEMQHVTKLPMVHRATAVAIDDRSRNFAVQQLRPQYSRLYVELPSNIADHFSTLLATSDITDTIHDTVIQVGSHQVAAHSYVLASRCAYLRARLSAASPSSPRRLVVTDVAYALFTHVLTFIYTGSCDVTTGGGGGGSPLPTCPPASTASGGTGGKSVVEQLREVAQRWEMGELLSFLHKTAYVSSLFTPWDPYRPIFDRNEYPHLYDACIVSDDGVEIPCHKCVLVARLDYFRSMLTGEWVEATSSGSLTLPASGRVLTFVIDYLYSDNITYSADADIELLCQALVIADHLLCPRLKECCEDRIAELTTFRTCCQLLDLATLHNAKKLKFFCQQFISENLAAILEMRLLDCLSTDVLDDLTRIHQRRLPMLRDRLITPYCGWPSGEYLEQLEAEVTHTDSMAATADVTGGKVHKKRRSRTKSHSETTAEGSCQRQLALSSDSVVVSDETRCLEVEISTADKDDVEPGRDELTDGSVEGPPSPLTPHPCVTSWPPLTSQPCVTSHTPVVSMKSIMDSQIAEAMLASPTRIPRNMPAMKSSSKLSKKERKKLAISCREKASMPAPDENSPKAQCWSPVINPWTTTLTGGVVESFQDLMLKEEKLYEESMQVTRHLQVQQISPRCNGNFSWGVAEKRCSVSDEYAVGPASPLELESAPSFIDIVRSEQHQVEAFHRATNKPLNLIQIEEQAMQQLLQSYQGAADSGDIRITVERVMPASLATPLWAANQRQHH